MFSDASTYHLLDIVYSLANLFIAFFHFISHFVNLLSQLVLNLRYCFLAHGVVLERRYFLLVFFTILSKLLKLARHLVQNNILLCVNVSLFFSITWFLFLSLKFGAK